MKCCYMLFWLSDLAAVTFDSHIPFEGARAHSCIAWKVVTLPECSEFVKLLLVVSSANCLGVYANIRRNRKAARKFAEFAHRLKAPLKSFTRRVKCQFSDHNPIKLVKKKNMSETITIKLTCQYVSFLSNFWTFHPEFFKHDHCSYVCLFHCKTSGIKSLMMNNFVT